MQNEETKENYEDLVTEGLAYGSVTSVSYSVRNVDWLFERVIVFSDVKGEAFVVDKTGN